MSQKVLFVLPILPDNNEVFKVCLYSEQNFLPRKYDKVLIYPKIREYLNAWASVTEILFSPYDPVPMVCLCGAARHGSADQQLKVLEELGWKKL